MKHPDSKSALESWFAECKQSHWTKPKDIKQKYVSASFLQDNRVVFNIAGNKYRLVVRINYHSETVFVRFIGTHKEYDNINAEEI